MTQGDLFPPPSDWKPPASLPEIPSGVVLAVDTEGRDNGLARDLAPGWATRDGHVSGVSVAWADQRFYVPMRHPETDNFDPGTVAGWIQDGMARAGRTVFHSRSFDEGWMDTEGVRTPEDADDIAAMAVMIDENQRSYSLDDIARRADAPVKDEFKLREAAKILGLDPKKDMWRMPARYVGGYAEQDAETTLRSWEVLNPQISEQNLGQAYRLEMDLVPTIIKMRRRGIRVDEGEADRVQKLLRSKIQNQLVALRDHLGERRTPTVEELNSPLALERMFDAQGIQYPRTPKTHRGSFKSEWMKDHEHWLPQTVSAVRSLNDLAEKFIGTYILEAVHLGRIHADIHPLRDDKGGTRSYRFSYSAPPLQQMPARSKLAPLIRGIFLPERGELWDSQDYSQQEPRLAVHFAAVCKCAGYQDAVDYYTNDPAADFHQMVAELAGITRKQAKIINLALMYNMGIAKLCRSLGLSLEEGQDIIDQYNTRMPFISSLNQFAEETAQQRGWIRLLDGARCRFDSWEPSWGRGHVPVRGREAAAARWPGKRLRRAKTRVAMNRLVQGSAARQTKLAMRECAREDLIPMIQMHDELGFSTGSTAQSRRCTEIMQSVVRLRIPMLVDSQLGHTWGQASEELDDREFKKGTPTPTFDELMHHGRGVSSANIVRARSR